MLPFDDPRWETYREGYDEYDVRTDLKKLLAGEATEELWHTLWDNLHHQGDVYPASYAAVPYLLEYAWRHPKLDWNVFGLIAVIELARPDNGPVPEEQTAGYFKAITDLPTVIGSRPDRQWSAEVTRCVAACMALAGGQRLLAKAYLELNPEAAQRFLEEEIGWSEDANSLLEDLYLRHAEDGYQGVLWQGAEIFSNDFEAEAAVLLRGQYEQRARELGVPFVDLSLFAPHPEALFLVPHSLAQHLNVLPLSRKSDALYIAVADMDDIQAIYAVRLHCQHPVRAILASPEDIRIAIHRCYGES